jgi:hypothetical protein
MNFPAFTVDTSNIFPMSNSHAGGQQMTEYNIRALMSAQCDTNVQYMIGPSFTRSESDFHVQILGSSDEYFGSGSEVGNAANMLEITAGVAMVDGYFIESLVPVTIDMIDTGLTGDLSIGLRAFFSTEQNIANSIRVEDSSGVYQGIQVVLLPKADFILPEDSPTDESLVTAHLKLADFKFINGAITNIVSNPKKCQYLPANRIGSIDSMLSSEYIKKTGLNPKRIYAFSGKGTDPATGRDTWCDATDALMIWDALSPQYTSNAPAIQSAQFLADGAGRIVLAIPHKQIDGMTDASGNPQYFQPVALQLPAADFNTGAPGTVTPEYTKSVRDIDSKLNNFYTLAGGRQRAFIEDLLDESDLPAVNPSWNAGDYILIANDHTVEYPNTDGISYPSTLRVVVPGTVHSIRYFGTDVTPPQGLELSRIVSDEEPPDPTDWDEIQALWNLEMFKGSILDDYFVYEWKVNDTTTHYIYYQVQSANRKNYSIPVLVSGRIPFADLNVVGGFMNVPEDAVDMGYVYLDNEGHLRLRDYGLLRSGTAAYQIGEDITVPTGLTIDGIQSFLDEYVNQRIAFPNANQQQRENPNVINIYMTIEDDAEGELTINDIDSRFSTSIYLHILGNATNAVTINIADCEKIRIDREIGGSPVINLYRSHLYYDYTILDVLNTIQDMTLWYERYTSDDPNLTVENMTVKQIASSSIYAQQDYSASEYWSADNPNDNHFLVALQSITFGSDGMITGCGVYVRNESTSNVEEGNFVIHDTFVLPLGPGLMYPVSRMSKAIKVTGQFVSAYPIDNPTGYMVQNTSFSMLTPTYSSDGNKVTDGDIAFLVQAFAVPNVSASSIDVWDTGSYHYFEGITTI